MTIYSFRAECPADVEAFKAKCVDARVRVVTREEPDKLFPDVEVEMETEASMDALQTLLREVVDGHVMLQTLRACPLSENSLERDCVAL
ncbi:MAG: hypothetical protein BGO63_03705 [Candidatus Accumulibacter sp. 66-26]|nr:MAG: hypothetical protein BGO63_03705 [Candidatus Accumulibacter sp. 66-26]